MYNFGHKKLSAATSLYNSLNLLYLVNLINSTNMEYNDSFCNWSSECKFYIHFVDPIYKLSQQLLSLKFSL